VAKEVTEEVTGQIRCRGSGEDAIVPPMIGLAERPTHWRANHRSETESAALETRSKTL
jgi:hypothetical protein